MSVNAQQTLPIVTNAPMPTEGFVESLKEANQLWLKGDAARGIPLYERLLTEVESALGKDSPLAGSVLFRIGILHERQGDFEKAIPLLERSLKLIESAPDNDQTKETKANLYWGLGFGHQSLLKYDQAIEAFKQALKLREELSGNESPKVAEILTSIADLYGWNQQFLTAIPLLERNLAINEKYFGTESLETAQAFASLGNVRSAARQFEPALACLNRSLEIRERLLGPTNVQVAVAAGNLGSLYVKWSEFSTAIPVLERSASLLASNVPTQDVQLVFQYATVLDNLGIAQIESGAHEKGVGTLRRSLLAKEQHLGGASINLVSTLNSLAVAYRRQGDFDRALPLLERALRILDDAPPQKIRELVDSLNNMAELLFAAGDTVAAQRLFTRSKELVERQFGTNDVSLAYSLNGLAKIWQQQGNPSNALAHFEIALAILEKTFGDSDSGVVGVLINISALLDSMGDTSRSLSTLQRALTIQAKFLPQNHPAIATSLNNLGVRLTSSGIWKEAQDALRRSIAITDALFGTDNPDSCERLENLGIAEVLSGNWARGLGEYVEAARRWRRYLARLAGVRPPSEPSRIQEKLLSSRNWFHSLCGITRDGFSQLAAFSGAEQLALGKALREETETVAARLATSGQAQIQQLWQQTDSIRKQLDAFAGRGEALGWINERVNWRTSERDNLEQELAKIEEKMAAASGLVAETIRERNLTLADIARSLPPQSVLVDFIQYRRLDFAAKTNQWKEARYAAYLTFPLGRDSTNVVVERVDLGEAVPINEAVEVVCKPMVTGEGYASQKLFSNLQRLSELVYAPLAKHLTNVSHLIVCPDGQLSRVPFEMLQHEGKFLIETKTMSYVGSGREIVRLGIPLTRPSATLSPSDEERAGRGAVGKSLVMGNPDFNLDLTARSSRREEAPKSGSQLSSLNPQPGDQSLLTSAATRSLSRDYRGMWFGPLTNAETEARSVARLLGGETVLRLGPEAREAELKAVVSPRVLHLATHGFFLSDQELRAPHPSPIRLAAAKRFGEAGWGEGVRRTGEGNDWENPMVRCGLALAGANHHTNSFLGRLGSPLPAASLSATNGAHGVTRPTWDAEDGLLTGLEASLLNLQGTELVILSACDSGTGEVKIGEGVMSLRRAFRIASAQTVLASHWPVNDKATSRLMTEFMQRWHSGKPRAQAWREAQLELLHSKDFSNPYFWSAFTLTGQWN